MLLAHLAKICNGWRYRETQRDTGKHRETQGDTGRHRETQGDTEGQRQRPPTSLSSITESVSVAKGPSVSSRMIVVLAERCGDS